MPDVAPVQSVRQPGPAADAIRAAFRDLHGARLHGFAILLVLGDRPAAARLASDALEAGVARIGELRHPERAAAWLRRRVVERARLARDQHGDALAVVELGAEETVIASMRGLDRLERAALIGSTIERLDPRDVAVIVDRDGPALDQLLRRARRRYIRAYAAAGSAEPPDGPITTHVRSLARRAMA
jgi:DNA-directed RNA polymerase specialized sigma24 family protein